MITLRNFHFVNNLAVVFISMNKYYSPEKNIFEFVLERKPDFYKYILSQIELVSKNDTRNKNLVSGFVKINYCFRIRKLMQ